METKNIDKLKRMVNNRHSSTGYKTNEVQMNYHRMRFITVAGDYDNLQFDPYIIEAIREQEKALLQRAFELEEADYLETQKNARKEATHILSDDILQQEYLESRAPHGFWYYF